MFREDINAVVYAVEEKQDFAGLYNDPVTIRTRLACAGRKWHFFVQDVLEDRYEYEFDEMGPHTVAEWQHLLSRVYEYGPCDGRCQTERFNRGETVKIDGRVVAEIPAELRGWRRARCYYRYGGWR